MSDNLSENKNSISDLPEPVSILPKPMKNESKKMSFGKQMKPIEQNNNTAEKPKVLSLEDLIEKNIKLSEIILAQSTKIKRRITLLVVGDYLKLLVIIAPIVVAVIYLPPIFKQVMSQYGELLGSPNTGFDLKSLFTGSQVKPQDVISNMSPENLQKLRDVLESTSK